MSTTTSEAVQIGFLSIPDHTGDTRIMWDPRDKDETRIAKDAFNAARAKGMLAYLVTEDGSADDGEAIREFPKKAGKIIMVKPLVGG